MNDYIRDRAIKVANYFLEDNYTIREVAREFGVSKSTIHADLTYRLEELNYDLYKQVREQLEYNKKVRHIRGGEATREYWQANNA